LEPCRNPNIGKAHIALNFRQDGSRDISNNSDACRFIPELKSNPANQGNQAASSFKTKLSEAESAKYYCEVTVSGNRCFKDNGVNLTTVIRAIDNQSSFELDAPIVGDPIAAKIVFYEACNSCAGGNSPKRIKYTDEVAGLKSGYRDHAWLALDPDGLTNCTR